MRTAILQALGNHTGILDFLRLPHVRIVASRRVQAAVRLARHPRARAAVCGLVPCLDERLAVGVVCVPLDQLTNGIDQLRVPIRPDRRWSWNPSDGGFLRITASSLIRGGTSHTLSPRVDRLESVANSPSPRCIESFPLAAVKFSLKTNGPPNNVSDFAGDVVEMSSSNRFGK